jgi:transcriptional regulator with XRE-family HTH domain
MNKPGQPATLGATLRSARIAAGLSVRQLAHEAGMNHSYLVKLETDQYDNPSADILQRLAEALGIDPSELLRFIGIKEASTLPPLRGYFRRKLGVDADEAEVLAQLIENYRKEREEGQSYDKPKTNEGGDTPSP